MINDLLDVVYYVEEYLGKLMFLIGIILLLVGVLSFNLFGSIMSAASVFFGIVCVVFGLFFQLGVFSVKFRSLNGVSIILFCASIVCLAFSFVVLEFLSTAIVDWDIFIIGHTQRFVFAPVFYSERPYLWVSGIFMFLGLALLIIGIVLRVYNSLKF
jgi:hypothetical protein